MRREAIDIILDIWRVQERWEAAVDPRMEWYGNMSFRRIDDLPTLAYVVGLQDREKKLKRELRKKVGWIAYIRFLFAPVSYAKSVRKSA